MWIDERLTVIYDPHLTSAILAIFFNQINRPRVQVATFHFTLEQCKTQSILISFFPFIQHIWITLLHFIAHTFFSHSILLCLRLISFQSSETLIKHLIRLGLQIFQLKWIATLLFFVWFWRLFSYILMTFKWFTVVSQNLILHSRCWWLVLKISKSKYVKNHFLITSN